MKIIIFALAFLFFFSAVSAQQRDTANTGIFYTLKHMTDTARPSVFRQENMVLYIGPRLNIFLSLDKFKRDSLLAAGNRSTSNSENRKPVTNTKIITNRPSHQLLVLEYLFRNYYYTTPYPAINWHITSDVKAIAGYSCKRAEGYYKGRMFHAWFTTETGLEGAPWKLQGLPGLVLEAYDTLKQVFFLFSKKENKIANVFAITIPPPKAIETTQKDFLQMREAAFNDPVGFVNSSNPATGLQLKITPAKDNTVSLRLRKPANPLELVDD